MWPPGRLHDAVPLCGGSDAAGDLAQSQRPVRGGVPPAAGHPLPAERQSARAARRTRVLRACWLCVTGTDRPRGTVTYRLQPTDGGSSGQLYTPGRGIYRPGPASLGSQRGSLMCQCPPPPLPVTVLQPSDTFHNRCAAARRPDHCSCSAHWACFLSCSHRRTCDHVEAHARAWRAWGRFDTSFWCFHGSRRLPRRVFLNGFMSTVLWAGYCYVTTGVSDWAVRRLCVGPVCVYFVQETYLSSSLYSDGHNVSIATRRWRRHSSQQYSGRH